MTEGSTHRMHGKNIEELHTAADSLQFIIDRCIEEANKQGTEVDVYLMQYPTGALIVAPMLSAQITILNQIEKLSNAED